MMSSEPTSSPVSASTLAYLMRWPVLRLIWLKLTFSVSDVAGYNATGQVTSERRKKPFQLARGAIGILRKRNRRPVKIPPGNPDSSERGGILSTALTVVAGLMRHGPEFRGQARAPGRCLRPAAAAPCPGGGQNPEHHPASGVCLDTAREDATGI